MYAFRCLSCSYNMLTTGGAQMQVTAGLFIVDFLVRPFAKIYQKMPFMIFLIMIVLYGVVGYIVWKSAYKPEEQY